MKWWIFNKSQKCRKLLEVLNPNPCAWGNSWRWYWRWGTICRLVSKSTRKTWPWKIGFPLRKRRRISHGDAELNGQIPFKTGLLVSDQGFGFKHWWHCKTLGANWWIKKNHLQRFVWFSDIYDLQVVGCWIFLSPNITALAGQWSNRSQKRRHWSRSSGWFRLGDLDQTGQRQGQRASPAAWGLGKMDKIIASLKRLMINVGIAMESTNFGQNISTTRMCPW